MDIGDAATFIQVQAIVPEEAWKGSKIRRNSYLQAVVCDTRIACIAGCASLRTSLYKGQAGDVDQSVRENYETRLWGGPKYVCMLSSWWNTRIHSS